MKNYLLLFFFIFSFHTTFGQEICDNAIDDDSDGYIDLLDGECTCNSILDNSEVPSLLPNHSFEEYKWCPTGWDGDFLVQNWWYDFTEPTSDYQNHCGWTSPMEPGSQLLTFPHGDGIMGTILMENYIEYIGCKLNSPLEIGHDYTFQFNVAALATNNLTPISTIDSLSYVAPYIELALWGNVDTLPPVNDVFTNVFGCLPFPEWEIIGTAYYVPNDEWSEINFSFIAQRSYKSVIIGAPCTFASEFPNFPIPHENARPYFFWDNCRINNSSNFGSRIERTGSLCLMDLSLEAIIDTVGATVQWFKDDIALIGETNNILNAQLYGSGEYAVRFSLGGNCETRTIIIEGMAGSNEPIFSVSAIDTICSGMSDTLNISGNADYYSWYSSENVFCPNDGSVGIVQFENTTEFTVTGYLNGCPKDTTFAVFVHPTPSIDIPAVSDSICFGDEYLLDLNLSNTQYVTIDYPSQIFLTPDDLTVINDSTYLLSPWNNVFYIFTAHNYFCTAQDDFLLEFSWWIPDVEASVSSNFGLAPLEVDFYNHSQNTINPMNYTWDFGNGQEITTTSTTDVSIIYTNPGTYYVTLNATPDGVCNRTWSDTIIVYETAQAIIIPNVFSPNNDQINDQFIVETKFLESFEINIVNRWGEIVAELNENTLSWDGTQNGQDLNEGEYFYHFVGYTVFKEEVEGHGFIHLER